MNPTNLIPRKLLDSIPTTMKATAALRFIGFLKIPLLFAVHPTVVSLDDKQISVRIRLNRRTRNHLGSMYFGTLAIGADCVVGLMAVHHIQKAKAKGVQLVFKDFHADFLKRPDGDVLFLCDEGAKVAELVHKAKTTRERHNLTVNCRAVLEKDPREPVAEFKLTLSLKRKA